MMLAHPDINDVFESLCNTIAADMQSAKKDVIKLIATVRYNNLFE